MNTLFSLFGKLIFILLLVGLLIGGGMFVGVRVAKRFVPAVSPTPTPSVMISPAISATPSATLVPTATATPSPTPVPPTEVQSGHSAFTLYSVTVPNGWDVKKEHDEGASIDKLTLSQNGYDIVVYQAPTGGAVCWYPGDPAPDGPSVQFKEYTTINGQGHAYRRGANDSSKSDKQGFTVCEKKDDKNYFMPTFVGHVSYSTPKNPDANMLKTMDGIVATVKKM